MHSESRNGAKVIWLAVHTTEGIMRATGLRDWTTWTGSSHASNDETGVLLSGSADGFVDYSLAAWTIRNGNHISDNLEQCGWARWTRAEWLARPLLLETTAQWLAERHAARPWIPLRRLTAAEIKAKQPGVLGHGDYTVATGDGTHTDPGPNFPWDIVLARANALVNGDDDMPTPDDLFNAAIFTDNPGTPQAHTLRLRDVLDEVRRNAAAAAAAQVAAGVDVDKLADLVVERISARLSD